MATPLSGDQLSALAREQAALRRVATLVARGVPPEEVFAAVVEEVGRLLPVDFTDMGRYTPDGTITFVAAWVPNVAGVSCRLPTGSRSATGGDGDDGAESSLLGLALRSTTSLRSTT